MRYVFTFCFCFFCLLLKAQWIPLNTGTSNELKTVEAVNANLIFAAGQNVLIKSTDGGSSWSNVPLLNTNNQPIIALTVNDLHFFDAQTGIAVGAQADFTRVILRTTDGGAHWSTVVNSIDPNSWPGGFLKVFFLNSSLGWASGTSGMLRKTTNGGMTWSTVIVPGSTFLNDVQFIDEQTGWVCGEWTVPGVAGFGFLAHSVNGGQNWTPWLNGGGQPLQDQQFFTPKTGLVAQQNYLIKLLDGADLANSQNVSMPDQAPVKRMQFFNESSGFAVTDYTVRRTGNGGLFWEQSILPLGPGQELNDLYFMPDQATGFIVGKGGKAFKTSNGGGLAVLPMAFFTPDLFQVCKNVPYSFDNPAPAGVYSSEWFLNGQSVSTNNDLTLSFPDAGTTYTLRLRITGPNGFSDFTRTFETPADINFDFGQLQWTHPLPVCAGIPLSFKVTQPAVNIVYTAFLNGVPFQSFYANDTSALNFTTPVMTAGAPIVVRASFQNQCASDVKSDSLYAEIIPYPTSDNAITANKSIVCLYDKAEITIKNSEVGVFYFFEGGFTTATPVEGNGGDLVFSTPPLFQSGPYKIIANRSFCQIPLAQTVQFEVDAFFNLSDTLNTYGMVGEAVKISNFTPNIAAASWIFGPQTTPPATSEIEPTVVYGQSGSFPYSYTYNSQGACSGTIVSSFEAYQQGPLFSPCPSNALIGQEGVYSIETLSLLRSATDHSGDLLTTGARFQPVGFWYTNNLFLQKNDPSGKLIWEKKVDPTGAGQGANYRSSYGTGLALDTDDNIYLSGTYVADMTRIFGQNFSPTLPENQSVPQGFLMKLDSNGAVKWNVHVQALKAGNPCAPADLLYSAFDGKLHMTLYGDTWQVRQPDGSFAANADPSASAWYISFDKDGYVQDFKALGKIPANGLWGAFHPALPQFNTTLTTYINPGLREGPGGTLYFAGITSNIDSVFFDDKLAVAADFGPNYLQSNHFVAVYNRNSKVWENAFFTHSVSGLPSYLDGKGRAWNVDKLGRVWIGFGLVQPENSFPGLVATLCKIGDRPIETRPNRGYLAQFEPDGTLSRLSTASNMFFHELLPNGADGMFALTGFFRTAGIRTPQNQYIGAAGIGKKDALLAEFSATGEVVGLLPMGTANYDQPLSAAWHEGSGRVYNMFIPDLNFALQSTAPQPVILQVHGVSGACPPVSADELRDRPLRFSVSPNPLPVGEALRIAISLEKTEKMQIILRDELGRILHWEERGEMPPGDHSITIDWHSRTAGVHFLEVATESRRGAARVVSLR